MDGCDRPRVGRGFCDTHYRRWRSTGTAEQGRLRAKGAPEERFKQSGYKVTSKGCHEWTRAKDSKGYGSFGAGPGRGVVGAHIFAWELANGSRVPAGLEVRHSCDNRACINPAHLQIGTHQDNIDDCTRRRRHAFGRRHPCAILTEELVVTIRERFEAEGLTVRDLAREYGMSESGMWKVVNRGSWKHVA
ncbi:HNH endonuclease [Mycobacterium adipatum]|uniref:HNH endonuclease n=1 Tax=Mycobacterium adipatum TaxID=1682113 RepID=UPI0034E07168